MFIYDHLNIQFLRTEIILFLEGQMKDDCVKFSLKQGQSLFVKAS